MKNKKLFAILTLVCFMFTLMPVAAFADAPTDNVPDVDQPVYAHLGTGSDVVEVDEDVTVQVTTGGTYYVYAVKDGAFAKLSTTNSSVEVLTDKVFKADFTAGVTTAVVTFDKPGEYTLMLAPWVSTTQQGIIANESLVKTDAQILDFLNGYAADVMMYNNVVKVGDVADILNIEIQNLAGVVTTSSSVTADNGYTVLPLQVQITNHGYGIPNVEVDLSVDSYGLKVTKVDAKTNAAGIAKFNVTGSVPSGSAPFHVYASYEGKTAVVAVAVTGLGAANVETVAEAAAPVDVRTMLDGNKAAGMAFKFTDAAGVTTTPGAVNKVTVLAAPAGYSRTPGDFSLVPVTPADGTYTIAGPSLNYEGEYKFQVSLQNGASAVASVTVKKMGEPTGITFVKAPATVDLGHRGFDVLGSQTGIFAVDANGVTELKTTAQGVKFSVNGKAVESFSTTDQMLVVKTDDKYIGSTITVLAVYEYNGKTFTATHNLTVVDTAASVVYTSTDAEVGVNSTLVARIVDENGKVVSLLSATPSVVILEKPEGAVATANATFDAAKGIVVTFLASAPGEYKVQTIVTYGTDKYVSSIDTITAGGAQGTFKDVIVMSIGANSLVKNSEVVAMPAAPEIVDSRTMVPARAGLEAFGAVVVWDEATQTVTAELNGVKVVMEIGEKEYTVNGKTVVGDAAPYITASSTMVPVSFFTNAFGITATPIYDDHGVCDVLFTK